MTKEICYLLGANEIARSAGVCPATAIRRLNALGFPALGYLRQGSKKPLPVYIEGVKDLLTGKVVMSKPRVPIAPEKITAFLKKERARLDLLETKPQPVA